MCNKPNARRNLSLSIYLIGKELNSNKIALVYQHVLRFIVLEVTMPCSCYLKAKRIKVVFVNKIIVLVLLIKARLVSRTVRTERTSMIGVDLHGPYMLSTLFMREILESAARSLFTPTINE